ncbi:MAG: type II secretion system protein GspM [Pseudomonadota bacterium]
MNRDQILDWYSTRTPREQLVVQAGGFLVVLMVLAAIFLPLQRNLVATRTALAKQQTDLEWMRQVGPALAAAGPAPASAATQESLVVLIDRSARESGLAQSLTGTQPAAGGGGGGMRVQLEHADFNLLTGWISRLSSQHGVRVESATITGSNSPGIVNATIQLRAR